MKKFIITDIVKEKQHKIDNLSKKEKETMEGKEKQIETDN